MSDTISVHALFDTDPTRHLVAEVLGFCNDGVSPYHPTRDELVLSADELSAATEAVLSDGLVGFQYGTAETSGYRAFDYSVGLNRSDRIDLPHLSVLINDTYFRTDDSSTDPADVYDATAELRSFLRELYRLVRETDEPRYLCALDYGDREYAAEDRPLVGASALYTGDLQFFWCQILPPAVADAVGRDRLTSAPAWRVEELDEGSVFVCVDELPKLPYEGLVTNEEAVSAHFET